MGVSRNLDYDVTWPVPGFVGLTVAQALALAGETGVALLDAGSAPLAADPTARVVRQEPKEPQRDRPSSVTVWVQPSGS
ncbi:hypothetical protein [Amycolatopsis albispora]|uniref:PASTA domain-containing protein n=1 Tax=Amycolatopsis albispora TaxID=1804986 RepID=A0A344L2J2_9PSEU|nr:hypothetical protein [Amycolatopsis albispora]AXB42266.1 hypothetical protein A4R43_06750 [Amycolatopsis albispora]